VIVQGLDESARWFRRPRGGGSAAVRLFCFHHAGGTATLFREWAGLFPQSIESVAVQLPGRAERFREPAYESMPPLIDALAEAMVPMIDQSFAFYGVSMGARLAWALAHRLRDHGMPMPGALYLACAAAPGWKEGRANWKVGKQELIAYLRKMGGTPPEIFTQPELLDSFLPTLRADLTVVDSFRLRPRVPLDMPIRAFAGIDDVEGPPERMSGWRLETRGPFHLHAVSGGHFFDAAGERQVIRTIATDLLSEYPRMGVKVQ
jgi:medium-chain acyl-[acyl-carrier-protein] hydrolase